MAKRGLTSSIFAAATEVTSALNQVNLRDEEKNVVSNKLMDAINNSKSIKQGDKCQSVLRPNKFFNRYDVTFNVAVLGLGLASQRGERFDKSTCYRTVCRKGLRSLSQGLKPA
jgi:hypothetical protein